jgi:hypothetical protein
LPGKVKNDLIDLRAFYEQVSGLIRIDEIRALCLQVVEGSVGTQVSKDRFIKLLKETHRTDKMLKLITDYALAGQGLGVVKFK